MIFSEKYRPKRIADIAGQRYPLQTILKGITQHKKGACVLLHGPIGSGKNSAISAIASEMNMELIELNASDLRTKDEINKIVRGAIFQKSLFLKKKLIVLDEIESISSREKSGLMELAALISQSNYPVILIANDLYARNISFLRKKYPAVAFKKLETADLMLILKRICLLEGIQCSENALKKIALLSGGDARAAINDLQASGKCVRDEISVSKRDQEVGIFNALRTIFRSNSFAVLNALDNTDIPMYEAMMWLDENIPVEFDILEMERAYNCLSKADIFHKRISRHNHWHFAVYSNALLTAGICFSKRKVHDQFVSYRRLTRLLKIWQSNREIKNEAAGKFGKVMHCSRRKIFREMHYLKMIYDKSDEAGRDRLSEELNLNSEEEGFILSK